MISWEITERTPILILLNSSKQDQVPLAARPLKNLLMALKSKLLEQLNTNVCRAIRFANSLVVSVLPVPTGPIGAPP